MSACPSLHFSLRSVRCFAVFPATGTGFRYTPRRQSSRVAEVERRFEAGAVEPLVPSSGTAAFLFADASSPAACAPWALPRRPCVSSPFSSGRNFQGADRNLGEPAFSKPKRVSGRKLHRRPAFWPEDLNVGELTQDATGDARHTIRILSRKTMPLPTAPVKLGNLLPSEEYKAKARPARSSKKQASDGDLVETETDFGASVGASRPAAANTANTLRAIASETLANAAKGSAVEASDAAPAARTRRAKQTAALLQPAATPAEQVETTPASPVRRSKRARRRAPKHPRARGCRGPQAAWSAEAPSAWPAGKRDRQSCSCSTRTC